MREIENNFFKDFERERACERENICACMHEGEGQREKQAPRKAGSPGSWDHDLSQRQMLNSLSHSGAPIFNKFLRSIPHAPGTVLENSNTAGSKINIIFYLERLFLDGGT